VSANFQFVQHVPEMDTTFPGNPLLWRSLRWVPLQHAAYLGIIAAELSLALGVLLWLTGFEVIGGEYFLMRQSPAWNGQESAFRFAVLCVLGLLFLAQHE
jgi:predicted small integral membrane protein